MNYGNLESLSDWNVNWIKIRIQSPQAFFFVGVKGLIILNWAVGMEVDGCGRDLRNCTICTLMALVCWDCMHENLSLFITIRAEWCYTLWAWRIIRLRKCGGDQEWYAVGAAWLRAEVFGSGGSLRVEMILRRLGVALTSEESFDVLWRVGRWETRVVILDGVKFWPL